MSRSRFTLEHLMELKRMERPSPAFWSRFEIELRRKERLLLQQHANASERADMAWHLFRKISSIACALTCCGIAAFMGFRGSNSDSGAPTTDAPLDALAIVAAPSLPAPAQSLPPQTTAVHLEPEAEMVPPSAEIIAAASQDPEPQEAALASLAASQKNEERSYTLTMPFASSIAQAFPTDLSSELDVASILMEKYLHPLRDRGHRYSQYALQINHGVKSITQTSLEDSLFMEPSSLDIKLDTLSLKF